MRKKLISLSVIANLMAGVAFAQDATSFRDGFVAGDVSWKDVQARAKEEGEINLYYWGGSDKINIWMDSVAVPALAAEGVKLNPVRIGEGSVDAIWVNGENFATLKRQDALMGAFADKLPNSTNIEWNPDDPRALLNLRDFGVETNAGPMKSPAPLQR